MSCWIPKGFLFFFFFQLRFLFIVRVLKTKSIFTIVVYAAREHELVASATCAIACTSVNFANSFVDLTAKPSLQAFC